MLYWYIGRNKDTFFWSVMDEYINKYGDEKFSLDVTSDCCSCSCKCSRRRRRRRREEEES